MKETASQIQDCMIALCRHCGELSLATAANLLSLRDTPEVNSEGQQDTRIKVNIKYHDEDYSDNQIKCFLNENLLDVTGSTFFW